MSILGIKILIRQIELPTYRGKAYFCTVARRSTAGDEDQNDAPTSCGVAKPELPSQVPDIPCLGQNSFVISMTESWQEQITHNITMTGEKKEAEAGQKEPTGTFLQARLLLSSRHTGRLHFCNSLEPQG